MVQIHIHVYISDDESWKYLEIYEISRKKSSVVKKFLKKKFLAQNSVFNVDYENKRDFVFTQNFFFQNLKKSQVSHRCV